MPKTGKEKGFFTDKKGQVRVPAADVADLRNQMITAERPNGETLYGSVGFLSPQGRDVIVIKMYPRRPTQSLLSPPEAIPGPRWNPPPEWQPEPALIIGLGGTGRHVLTHIKKNLLDAGSGEISNSIKLALLDSADYELVNGQQVAVSFAGVSLAPEDIVEFGGDMRPVMEAILKDNGAEPETRSWFPAHEYKMQLGYDELNLSHGTRQRRPPVRAALIQDLKRGITEQGMNVVLLVDHSASMSGPFTVEAQPITKLEAAQRAAALFVDQLDLFVDQVAVVKFAETATCVCEFTQQPDEIKSAMGELGFDDNTAIHTGLEKAQEILELHSGNGKRNVVILLTDGQSSPEEAQKFAQSLKEHGTYLISIGIGDANEDLLRKLASSSGEKLLYYYAHNAEELSNVFIDLGRQLGEGARLWRLLHGGAKKALRDGELRVILVGSLAGGFGSSVLMDVAYLARRAGQKVGASSISIEAYLATAGVFGAVAGNQEKNAINTFASIREVERFQLAQGYPFRMLYKADAKGAEQEVLDADIDWRLFDELYLFDKAPPVEIPEDMKVNPQFPVVGVFPAIADAIAFGLDKAGRADLGNYRRSIEGDVSAEHRALGRAAIGSLGIYVYRLPMRDLFEILKARWVRELLFSFLMGSADGGFRVEPGLDQEEDPATVSDHVLQFLLGGSGYESPPCPASTQFVGRLTYEGVLSDLDQQYEQVAMTEPGQEAEKFQAYLVGALLTMLNGLQTNDVIKARGGKLGYVRLFLDTLQKDLEKALLNLENRIPLMDEFIRSNLQFLEVVRSDLSHQTGLLTHTLSSNVNSKPGIYEKLELLEIERQNRLEQIRGLLTRRYIYPDDWRERWYKKYFSDPALKNEALSRLFWTSTGDTRITLGFRTWGDFSLGFSPLTMEFFVAELLRFAGYVGRGLLQNETLASVLNETALSPVELSRTGAKLRDGSKPLLDYKPENSHNLKYLMLLGINRTVEAKQELTQLLREGLPGESKFRSVEITDPYSMVVAQVIDVIPVTGLQNFEYWGEVYKGWYGLMPGRAPNPRSEQSAIFHAEKAALSFERRLQTEIQQVPRLLRPIVVSALDNPQAAIQYALAFAAGWIRYQEPSILILVPGSNEAIDLPRRSTTIPVYVEGFLSYSITATDGQIAAVKQAIESAGAETFTLWRQWTTRDWQEGERPKMLNRQSFGREEQGTSQEAADLASIVAIATRDELSKRMREGVR